jgi:signal transduction histidine kinase
LLKDSEGNPIGFYGISRDVTERRRAEKELEEYRKNLEIMVRDRTRELEEAQQELVRKEKLAVLGQLTATVSHELRNPLGVIRSSNFYLQRKVDKADQKLEKHFKRIEEQVDICDSIVGELLEYTRGRHVETVRQELSQWLEPLLDQLFEKETIPLRRGLNGPLLVHHDQEKLRRVIINLTDNAFQAVRARQEMWKYEDDPYDPEIYIGTRGVEDGVVIEISDNGTGMDSQTLEHALEPLFTTRARGTGLGLANVDKIVKEHSGELNLESEPGRGTRVTVFLPDRERMSSV